MTDGLYFTREHEWVRVEGDIGTVGISDYAQGQLGDVVFVELPAPGATLKKGDGAAVVESVKAASDIYAPVSGEVVAANDALPDTPDLVNSGAETEGWFFRLRLTDPGELGDLMDEKAYRAYAEDQD